MAKSKICSHCGEPSMPSAYYCTTCHQTAVRLSKAVKQQRLTPWQQQALWRETYHSPAKTRVLLETLRGN